MQRGYCRQRRRWSERAVCTVALRERCSSHRYLSPPASDRQRTVYPPIPKSKPNLYSPRLYNSLSLSLEISTSSHLLYQAVVHRRCRFLLGAPRVADGNRVCPISGYITPSRNFDRRLPSSPPPTSSIAADHNLPQPSFSHSQ